MHFLEELKKWLGEITEIFLLLIAIGIAVEILFGSAVPFFGGVVARWLDCSGYHSFLVLQKESCCIESCLSGVLRSGTG